MPDASKLRVVPSRRRPRPDLKPRHVPKGCSLMTLEVTLTMAPVYDLLAKHGIDWQAIPEREFAVAADIWRRDRIAKETWNVNWQADGEAFMLNYAQSHRWFDSEVIERLGQEHRTLKSGDLTEAQRNAMTHEEYLDWERAQID